MAARADRPRKGSRVPPRGGPLVPLVLLCLGVVTLTAAVTLDGEESSPRPGGDTGVVTAASAADPVALPPTDTCALQVEGAPRGMSMAAARTLTQIVAVGWQVKAPEEMVARVLDLAAAKPNQSLSVTDALDLFTREDSTVPSAEAVAKVRSVTEPGGLTCVFDPPAAAPEAKKSSGLTPRAEVLRQGVIDAFGQLTMSGYGAKAAKNSPEAAGRALNVAIPETPVPGAGWVLAHWLMARGADYKLATVAHGDRVWSPSAGWATTEPGQALAAAPRPGRVYVVVTAGAAAAKTTKAKDTGKAGSAKRR